MFGRFSTSCLVFAMLMGRSIAFEGEDGGGKGAGGSQGDDQNNNGSGTQKEDGQGSSSQKGSGNGSGTQNQGKGDEETFSRKYVEDLRKEAGDSRVRANNAERELGNVKDENTKLRAKVSELTFNQIFDPLCKQLGAARPELVLALIDRSKVETDAEGVPDKTKLEATLKDLKTKYPELFKTAAGGAADGGASGGSSGGTMNDFIRQAAGRQ